MFCKLKQIRVGKQFAALLIAMLFAGSTEADIFQFKIEATYDSTAENKSPITAPDGVLKYSFTLDTNNAKVVNGDQVQLNSVDVTYDLNGTPSSHSTQIRMANAKPKVARIIILNVDSRQLALNLPDIDLFNLADDQVNFIPRKVDFTGGFLGGPPNRFRGSLSIESASLPKSPNSPSNELVNDGWTKVGSGADAVATGNDGSLWKLGSDTFDKDNPNHSIQKYVNDKWKQVSGWGVKLTVDGSGNAWGIDSANELFRYEGDKPVVVHKALDVEADNMGRIWVINEEGRLRFVDAAPNYRFVPFKKEFENRLKAMAVVQIGKDAFPMIIDDQGKTYLFNGVRWDFQKIVLVDLTAGPDGLFWAIDSQSRIWKCRLIDIPYGAPHMQLSTKQASWEKVKGSGTSISVGKEVYITDANGHFYVAEKETRYPSPTPTDPSTGQLAETTPYRGIVDNSRWMGQNEVLLNNRKLSETILCESHNAGSYSINANSDFSIADLSWNAGGKPGGTHALKTLSSMNKEHTAGMAKCQSRNIASQLNDGIRYFDLRLFINKEGQFQSSHSMWGASYSDMFTQMKQFLNAPEHEKEVVVLQFKGFKDERRSNLLTLQEGIYQNDFTPENWNEFEQLAKSHFGSKIYLGKVFEKTDEWADVSFGRLWSSKAQVILTKSNSNKDYDVSVAGKDWCPETTKNYIKAPNGRPSVSFSKSPSTEMVVGMAFTGASRIPTNIRQITDDVAPVVFSWLVDPNFATPSSSSSPKLSGGKGINLFSADYYERMPLLDLAHYLNGLGNTNHHLNKAKAYAKSYTNWNNWAWCDGGKIIVYEHNNREGKSLVLGEGRHNSSVLGDLNNKISSISIPFRLKVTALGNDGVGGGRRILLKNVDDLSGSPHHFNDKISSLLVERTIASAAQQAEFFEHSDQKGNTLKLGPGEYNQEFLISKGFNDKISSIRVPARFRVTLFRNDNFKRILVRSYHQGNHNLPRTANDEASSIRVTAIGIPK